MITYLYYKVYEYFQNEEIDIKWQKTRALIATSSIIVTNILTFLFLINTVFYRDINLLNLLLTKKQLIDKFILIPLLIAPVLLIVYYYGWNKLDDNIERFRDESEDKKKKKGKIVVIYIGFSFLLVTLSIFSPLFIN